MKIEKVDHICFAVRNINEIKSKYLEYFGLSPSFEYSAESEKIRVVRYDIGGVGIEFIEPTDNDSEVAKFLSRKGEGPYLIAYKVDDLENALEELRRKNVKLIDQSPRELFGAKYAFIQHPREFHGILTELVEGEFKIPKKEGKER
ncbi:MAG: VOC family protein [Desulfobacterota bacterium]|nr:VOC family protein [Thermodesulfobacteriota bacterium]MDW8002167.1 VOC family protein [Deltaproteobacteria bacterium]